MIVRTFIAVDLPEPVKTRISDLVHRLKFAAPSGIGWVRIADLHLTVKFLGEIDETGLPAVENAVRTIAADTSVFPLSITGTGTFPPGSRKPRVIWIGIKDETVLPDLHGRLENSLAALGHPREDRPFHPHMTIGRVKTSGLPQALLDRLAEYASASFGDMEVREIVVYRSVLHPRGPEYTPLFKGALRA